MNKVILMGRLTRDPEVRYSQSDPNMAVSKYTLAVDRMVRRGGERGADFIRCTAFGSRAEFAEKYLRKGIKIVISGRLQTGSYNDSEGRKVYTTEVIIDSQEFAESRREAADDGNGYMELPDGIDDDLPFN